MIKKNHRYNHVVKVDEKRFLTGGGNIFMNVSVVKMKVALK